MLRNIKEFSNVTELARVLSKKRYLNLAELSDLVQQQRNKTIFKKLFIYKSLTLTKTRRKKHCWGRPLSVNVGKKLIIYFTVQPESAEKYPKNT